MAIFGDPCIDCGNRTRRKDGIGQPLCADCQLQRDIEAEEERTCLECSLPMTKETIEDIIIDRCPSCGGVWLDKDELNQIKELSDTSGFALGLCYGTAIG